MPSRVRRIISSRLHHLLESCAFHPRSAAFQHSRKLRTDDLNRLPGQVEVAGVAVGFGEGRW